jgi:outer membrane usher protein
MLRHRLRASKSSALALLLTLGLAWPGASCAAIPETVSNEPAKTDSETPADTADDVAKVDSEVPVTTADETAAAAPPVLDAPAGATPLQLDVKINGVPTGMIAAFYQMTDGGLSSTRGELKELGIVAPGEGQVGEIIVLTTLPNVKYDFNEAEQIIDLHIDSNLRVRQEIDAYGREAATVASSDRGILLNYSLFSAFNTDYGLKNRSISGLSSFLEARLFSEFGSLELSGVVATPDFKVANSKRLETTYSFEDPKRTTDYQLGDVVSGSMNWTRSVRLGGAKARRNFGLRPDLVTMPLPTVTGTAAVPSTLDVYIGGVRSYTKELKEGPFTVTNIPVYTNEGTARYTLTDATGRRVETESDFYTSPRLLREKLFDFSVDAGFLRERYGEKSFDYVFDDPAVIGNLRYGISDLLTAEVHVEGGMHIQNAGIGALTAIPQFGTFNLAGSVSRTEDDLGYMLYGAWEKRWGNLTINASTQRSFGDFQDLASVQSFKLSGKKEGAVPKAIDQIGIGYLLPDYDSGVGVSLIHAKRYDGTRDLIASGSLSTTYGRVSLIGGGFYSFGDEKDYGVSISASMPLGKTYSASSTAAHKRDGQQLGIDLSKSHEDKQYSLAGRVGLNHRGKGTAFKQSEQNLDTRAELRTPVGTVDGSAVMHKDRAGMTAGFSGAVVGTKKGILFGRNVGDAFAVVNTGAKGVRVRHENRYVGLSNRNGQLLVPNIVPYTKNKFDIDLDDLPLTAQMPESEHFVVPRSKSGVIVDFNVKGSDKAAIVIIKDSDGKFIENSAEVILDGAAEPFLMGYDGEVYLTGLEENNKLNVKRASGDCVASFEYKGDGSEQGVVGPITCTSQN